MKNKASDKQQPTSVLAFDWGEKRIGVAAGQLIGETAGPIAILKARDGIPNWQEIQALLDEWQPNLLVIGHPLYLDGTESPIAPRAQKFARRLEGRFNYPTCLVDERLTSEKAKEVAETYNLNVDKGIDDIAAVQILRQYWFEQASTSD